MTHRSLPGLLANPHRFPTLLVPEPGANFADPRSGSLCGSKSHIGPSEHCGKSVHVLHRFPSLISCTKCLQPTFGVFHVSNTFGGFEWKKFIARTARMCKGRYRCYFSLKCLWITGWIFALTRGR